MTAHQHTHGATTVVDPVRGMTISPEGAVGRITHNGADLPLCRQSCLARLRANPETFLQPR